MALPKKIEWVTFDVYGTLIDWEKGVVEAFEKEAKRDGFSIDRDQLVELFHEVSRDVESGSYELYAEVLRRTAIEIAKKLEWPLEPSRSGFLPDSVQRWAPFRESNAQLKKFVKNFQTGLISNVDDKLLGQTRRHIPHDFDLVVTAQQVRSYKPDPAHFKEFARRIGGKKGWVHVASSLYHDVEPAIKEKVPVVWVNRQGRGARGGQEEAGRRGQEPRRGVRAPLLLRIVSVHRDVLVATSRVWQTSCTVVRSGDEAFVIDSPVYPDELDVLPAVLEQASFPLTGLLVTHGDWDHLLGRLAFPGAAIGCAETTAARLTAEPGAAARELRDVRRRALRRPLGAAVARRAAGAAGPGEARHRRRGARAARDRGPHRGRDGGVGPVGARARRRRLRLARRDPDAARERVAQRVPRDARAARAARRAGGDRRARPRRGDRLGPRARHPARGRAST